VIVADTGATVTRSNGFEYLVPGKIVSLSLTEGQEGTETTIVGTNLLGGGDSAASVHLADDLATLVSFSNTEIKIVAPHSTPDQGNVLITADTGARVVLVNGWKFNARGNMTEVSPSYGHGGTVVTITGVEMLGGGDSVRSLKFAGVEVLSVTSATEDKIVAVVAPGVGSQPDRHTPNPEDIVVVANTGASVTMESAWTNVPAGIIEKVDPEQGQIGTHVVITGTGLLAGGVTVVAVSLADEAVDSDIVHSSAGDILRDAASAAHAASAQAADDAQSALDFYLAAKSKADTTGVAADALAALQAEDVADKKQVVAEEAYAAAVDAQTAADTDPLWDDSRVEVVAPAGAAKTGSVTLVVDTGATVTVADAWTFLAEGAITDVSPSSGQIGTSVTIIGTNLLGGGTGLVSVELNGIAAEITSATDEAVVVVAAASGASGVSSVVLVADTGAIVRGAELWTYLEPSVVSLVSPNSGQFRSKVKITGTGLRSGGAAVTNVTLAGVAVREITFESDTVVEVVADRSSATEGPVVLTADTGAFVVSVEQFKYHIEGDVTVISPATGVLGTRVTVAGTALLGGGTEIVEASVANTIVESIDFQSDTKVIMTVAHRDVAVGATCDLCHASCASAVGKCSGAGSDECTECPDNLVSASRCAVMERSAPLELRCRGQL
jgi:mucin-19